jgi:hypothetical protein
MLDMFLKAAYARSEKEKQIDKVAFHMGRGGGGPDDWLDKFKGTPLLPKALGLLQQEIQLDQQDMAMREQRDAEMESSRQLWKMRDAVCLQKRMLDLELASSELAGFPAAPPPVGMMPAPPPEAVEAAAAPEGMPETPSPKEAAMRMKMAAEKIRANKYMPPSKENMRLLQKLQDKRKGKGFIESALTTITPEKKASVDLQKAAQLMRMKEAAGVLSLPKAVWGGIRQVGRSASKGYGKEGLKGALTRGSRRFSTIAKMSPATAAGMVAVPAAAIGAAGLGAGYMAGR